MSTHLFCLSSNGYTGTVHLDGQDISRAVRDVTVKMRAGDAPQVTLDLEVHAADEIALKADVNISDPTRDLLTRLGWTPPTDAAQPIAPTDPPPPEAGAAITAPHEHVVAADTDQLLTVLFNGRYHLMGNEDAGVELYCRDSHGTSQPLGYYTGRGRHANQAVPTVATIPALLDIAARHEADAHLDH